MVYCIWQVMKQVVGQYFDKGFLYCITDLDQLEAGGGVACKIESVVSQSLNSQGSI